MQKAASLKSRAAVIAQAKSFKDRDLVADRAYAANGGISGLRMDSDEQTIQVSRSQLKGVMKSKLDIYNILTKEGQLYLPPINDCPLEFIHAIINGKKKVFKNSELNIIDVPNFEELSAKNI